MHRKEYIEAVQKVLSDVEERKPSVLEVIIKLKALDDSYFGSDRQKILMSRHGQSGLLHKAFGANPNAGLEEACNAALRRAAATTGSFLRAQKRVRFISSPMRRSLQTAAFLLPEKWLDKASSTLEQNHALAENSDNLSGKNIQSIFDLLRYALVTLPMETLSYMFAPKLLMPLRMMVALVLYPIRLLQTFINLIAWPFFSAKLKRDSQIVLDHLEKKGFNCSSPGQELYLTASQKITNLDALINEKETDVWLFGHGNNFKAFFKEKCGILDSFDYAEVRTVFKKADGAYEAASYVLKINQKSGAIVPKLLLTPHLDFNFQQSKTHEVAKIPTSYASDMSPLLEDARNAEPQIKTPQQKHKPFVPSDHKETIPTVAELDKRQAPL